MKRFFFTFASLVIVGFLAASTTVQASHKSVTVRVTPSHTTTVAKINAVSHNKTIVVHQNNVHVNKVHANNVHVNRVHVSFYARSYRGWNRYCYMPQYGCYCFFDPTSGQWFYWYQPTGQFLPMSQIANQLPTTNGSAMLPPGAVPVGQQLPAGSPGQATLPTDPNAVPAPIDAPLPQ